MFSLSNVGVVWHSFHMGDLRERSLYMAGVGTEEEVLFALKKFYPTICLSQIFFTPPKENSKTRLLVRLDMVYAFTIPMCSKMILLPHLTQPIFSVTPSSVPTPVINNDRSLNEGNGQFVFR